MFTACFRDLLPALSVPAHIRIVVFAEKPDDDPGNRDRHDDDQDDFQRDHGYRFRRPFSRSLTAVRISVPSGTPDDSAAVRHASHSLAGTRNDRIFSRPLPLGGPGFFGGSRYTMPRFYHAWQAGSRQKVMTPTFENILTKSTNKNNRVLTRANNVIYLGQTRKTK